MPPKRQRKSKKQAEGEDDDNEINIHVKNLLKHSNIVVQSIPTGRTGTHLVSSVPSYQHGKPQKFSNKENPKPLVPKHQQPVNTDEGSREAKLVYKTPAPNDGIKAYMNNIKASLQHLR